MFQLPQNTGMSDSMGSVANSVPKVSNMMIPADKCMVLPDKIYISINDAITIDKAEVKIDKPKLLTDGEPDKPAKATKSESAEAIKIKERWKKAEDKEKKWRKSVKSWQENMVGTLTKTLTDNPITNFIKDHWGKLLIGLSFLFLKPAQMKKVWEALKGMATWLWENGPGIFKGMVSALETIVPMIGKLVGGIFKWLFGKTAKEKEQEKLDDMVKDGAGMFQSQESYANALAEQNAKVNGMEGGGERSGGVADSMIKKVIVGLGLLALALGKFGPKGILFRGLSKGLGAIGNMIKNPIMDHKAQGFLTDKMKNMDRGKRLSTWAKGGKMSTMMSDTGSYLGNKAGQAKNIIKNPGQAASKVGGAVKNVASAGGDWFKSLMGKFGTAGKFLAKMGKSVIQGLMTMGPYGWAIIGGIALGGLVWYFWDDITKVWDKVAGAIKAGFNAILDFASNIVGSAKSMLGGFLRSVGAGMIADFFDPEGADPEEKKKEFTWGGFAEELWAVYSGIWKKIIDLVKALNPIDIAKKVASSIWSGVKGVFGVGDDAPETPETPSKPKPLSKGKWMKEQAGGGGEKQSAWMKKMGGKEKVGQMYKDYKANFDESSSEPSTTANEPSTTATPRAIKYMESVRAIKSTKERNKKIKTQLMGPDGKELYEAMSPKEQDQHRGRAMIAGIITKEQALKMTPTSGVPPTLKADTLNQVQGENADLKSNAMVVAPITNVYNTTNNNGGGEGGTAIYSTPSAQQGNQHRHSNTGR